MKTTELSGPCCCGKSAASAILARIELAERNRHLSAREVLPKPLALLVRPKKHGHVFPRCAATVQGMHLGRDVRELACRISKARDLRHFASPTRRFGHEQRYTVLICFLGRKDLAGESAQSITSAVAVSLRIVDDREPDTDLGKAECRRSATD
jgi:hypothetical protein